MEIFKVVWIPLLGVICACAAAGTSIGLQDLQDDSGYAGRRTSAGKKRTALLGEAVRARKSAPPDLRQYLLRAEDELGVGGDDDGDAWTHKWRQELKEKRMRNPDKRKAAAAAEEVEATAGRRAASFRELVPYPVFIPRLLLPSPPPHPLLQAGWPPLLI